jgi:organic hydroperoxide reductase OsmC/OhrA
MPDLHQFEAFLNWPADPAQPKPPEAVFSRDNTLQVTGKTVIPASAPAVFGGDASRYNPEELMIMSLAECHMLTYLAVAAKKRLAILAYQDRATGSLGLGASGTAGKMSLQEVVLRPRVTVARGTDLAEAMALHEKAHANCFMANSVNFPVRYEPQTVEA